MRHAEKQESMSHALEKKKTSQEAVRDTACQIYQEKTLK